MADFDQSRFYRPFADLDKRLRSKKIELGREKRSPGRPPNTPLSAGFQSQSPGLRSCRQKEPDTSGYLNTGKEIDDAKLFMDAMADVTPLKHDKHHRPCPPARTRGACKSSTAWQKTEVEKLRLLVEKGVGFRVNLTPEYLEATAPDVPKHWAAYLHEGKFSIQDWIDLHGCTAAEARSRLDRFIRRAIINGKRNVLIIHGRGLKSKDQPVIKSMIFQYLTRGHWRKWVIAIASARLCDGGAGASYVLLRKAPLSKKELKSKNLRCPGCIAKNI